MERYIRTKDGEIFDTEVNGAWETESGTIGIPTAWGIVVTPKEFIAKRADTIEELCDRFVYVTNKGNHYIKNSNKEVWLALGGEKPIAYYGAIWTDKGLIYRAKMNEKGELELL